jgi:hydroxymethylpyrimidine kinase/phosphomethylpyrimidine kinase
LIDDAAVESLVTKLFPLARVVTPNIPEAERLTQVKIRTEEDMIQAAARIRELGPGAVLIKGGHMQHVQTHVTEAVDVLDDQGTVTLFREEMLAVGEVHGSGCTLSAAIAACLGRGDDLASAVREAKRYVTNLIRNSPRLGHGAKPLF